MSHAVAFYDLSQFCFGPRRSKSIQLSDVETVYHAHHAIVSKCIIELALDFSIVTYITVTPCLIPFSYVTNYQLCLVPFS